MADTMTPGRGTGWQRVDGPLKVQGRAEYAGDLSVPGMCHAVLVQSTIARGLIERIESEAAERSPGVLAIFTHANLPVLQAPPEEFTRDFPAERRAPLSDARVHYAGQHVALVIAETLLQATCAAALVTVSYQHEEPVLDLAWGLPGEYAPDHFATNDKEQLKAGRGTRPAAAAHRVELEYQTPVEHHNPIEPSATVAVWNGERLLLYDSTRWVQGSRNVIAHMLGIPEAQVDDLVEVRAPFVGGAFGSKGFLWQHVALCAQAARTMQRPVKLVLSRGQMFTSTGHRPRTRQSLVLAADAGARVLSIEHHTLSETSPVAHYVEPAGMTARNLYSSPHASISHKVTPINLPTPCFMRGPGESPGMFALESAMDETAVECELDPLEFRLRNYAERDKQEDRPWSSKHLRTCYRVGAERFGWARRQAEPRSMRRGARLVGWGMATAAYPGRRSPAKVRAQLGRDGVAEFSAATHEIGTGTATVMEQVASEALGWPRERVRFLLGNSIYTQAPVAGASQTTASVAPAVDAAARELRGKLLRSAVGDPRSPLFGQPAEQVRLHDGVLHAGGANERVEELLSRMPEGWTLNVETAAKPDEQAAEAYTFHSFGAHFCEVEVDPAGLDLRVTRWVAAMDCGRILNPVTARAQVRGGVIFGLGMALMEQTIYHPSPGDQRRGLPVNGDLSEYLLPTCADVPEIEVELVEEPDRLIDPLGVRGIGEIGVTGVAAAVANAVWHATGVRVRKLPLSLEKLVRARAGEHVR